VQDYLPRSSRFTRLGATWCFFSRGCQDFDPKIWCNYDWVGGIVNGEDRELVALVRW